MYMIDPDDMKKVTELELVKFIEGKNLSMRNGNVMHSTFWIDENGVEVAYERTSSWGAPGIFMIKEQ